MEKNNRRAVLYLRLSQAKGDDESDSIANQRRALHSLAIRKGLEVVDEYSDDGVSGWKEVERPGFMLMMASMKKKKFDVILVRHSDRLSRNDGDSSLIRTLCAKFGVMWITADGTETDPGTSGGALTAKIFAAVDEFESALKSERLKMHYLGLVERGDFQAPKGTFGYLDEDRSKVVPAEASLIRIAYQHVATGGSVGSIVRAWNKQEVRQRKGATRWTYAHVNAILRRPRNAGLIAHKGKILNPRDDKNRSIRGNWETIIDVETWKIVNAVLNNRIGTGHGFLPRHLSSGIARCAICGSIMRSNTATDRRRGTRYSILRCEAIKSGVRHASARLDHLEPLVRKAVLDAFMFGPESIVPEITRVDITLLQNRLESIGSAKQEILDLIRDGLATNADARSQLKELRDDEVQARSSIEEARAASTSADMLFGLRRDLWPTVRIDWSSGFNMAVDVRLELSKRFDALPIEDRRGLVETLLDIRVHPGRGIEKYEVTHSVVTHLNPCVVS